VQQVMVHRASNQRSGGSQLYSIQQGIDIPLTTSQKSALYTNTGGSYVDKYPKDGPKPRTNKTPTSVVSKDVASNVSWRPTQSKYKEVCYNYINGRCDRGDKCLYRHDKTLVPKKTEVEAQKEREQLVYRAFVASGGELVTNDSGPPRVSSAST
jgi:hypothetical protein